MIRHNGITIDRHRKAVSHDGVTWMTPGVCTFRIVESLILGGGLTKTEIADVVYRGREDGGPTSYGRTIETRICNLKRTFDVLDLELRRSRTWPRQYWLEPRC